MINHINSFHLFFQGRGEEEGEYVTDEQGQKRDSSCHKAQILHSLADSTDATVTVDIDCPQEGFDGISHRAVRGCAEVAMVMTDESLEVILASDVCQI